MKSLTRRTLLGAAPVALAGAAVVGRAPTAQAIDVTGGTLALVAPFRLFDSRQSGTGEKYAVGGSDEITVPDLASVHGVVLNVTITDTEGQGFVRVADKIVWPPPTSTINWYATGQTLANFAIVRTTAGSSKVTFQLGGTTGGKLHIVLDVIGYIT
jgi:hypothetical protein